MQTCAMFAERQLLPPAGLELSPKLAWATFQPAEAQLRFLDWPGEFPPELPSAALEKFPGRLTSGSQS